MPDPLLFANALRVARRELRGGLHGFGVFAACLFLGVFAIAAIGSFSAAARGGLLADAAALLGGDLEVRLVHREADADQHDFLARRGRLSKTVELRTMAFGSPSGGRTLVELKAVDDAYPLYGTLVIDPPQALGDALALRNGHHGALVEGSLLARLKLQRGDLLRMGEAQYLIRGVIASEPDRTVRAFDLGPRVMVDQAGLEASGLVRPGSLVNYAYRVRIETREEATGLKEDLARRFPDAGWRVRTWEEAAPRVRRFIDRASTNLTLLGLCALLIGGLGVSGAVRGYLDGKTLHIATMKCLGAEGRTIFTAYLLQVLLLGGIASSAGLLAGAALPYLVKYLLGGTLPIPLRPALDPWVLVIAPLFGLLIALAFSLQALGSARLIPPTVLFRGYAGIPRRHPGRLVWMAIAAAVGALVALTLIASDDRRLAVGFIAGALACFVFFRQLTAAVVSAARRLPRPSGPRLRLALANIHRPGAPAPRVMFSLGLGLTTLVLIALVQNSLDALVQREMPRQAPTFFVLDLQPNQTASFDQFAAETDGVRQSRRYPTLRGRITAIAGVPVEEAAVAPEARWAVRGDRYLSYSATLPEGSELLAGVWWPEDYRGEPLLSLSADLAEGFGLALGDTLTVNVLGREVKARIASLRRTDWSTLRLDFALIFSPGVLEGAPQTHIAALHLEPGHEGEVFNALTDLLPNVSVIDVREVLANAARTLNRIGLAFRGMAAVALLSGLLVLAGALSADQHRRIHDAVIFKVCGATRRDVVAIFAFEFLLLGLCAGGLSAAVGTLAAWGVVESLMGTPFVFDAGVVAFTLLLAIALTVVSGLFGTWKALGQPPAGYLREH